MRPSRQSEGIAPPKGPKDDELIADIGNWEEPLAFMFFGCGGALLTLGTLVGAAAVLGAWLLGGWLWS